MDITENKYIKFVFDELGRVPGHRYSSMVYRKLNFDTAMSRQEKDRIVTAIASHRGTESNMCVGGLLGVSECSQVTDGAAVVVLCSEAYAKEHNLTDKSIVKGYGHRTAPMLFDKKIAENTSSEYVLPWTRQACLYAYKRAGLTVDDIDVFETHDCFTSSEYAAISAFGITEPSKEYEAVENGVIAFDGAKPINPSGGLIGCGHPVGASGARMFLDLYKQVIGKAGGYQVKNASNGMMLNIGGSATTNYVFIVGKEYVH